MSIGSTFNSKVMARASPASPAPKRGNMPSTIRELFDVNNYVRKIKVSELFKANLENDAKVIINQLRHCDKIVGVVDYFSRVKNSVLRRFV